MQIPGNKLHVELLRICHLAFTAADLKKDGQGGCWVLPVSKVNTQYNDRTAEAMFLGEG